MKSGRLSVAAGTGRCLVARPQLPFTFNACSVLFTICVAADKIEEATCSLGSAFFFSSLVSNGLLVLNSLDVGSAFKL